MIKKIYCLFLLAIFTLNTSIDAFAGAPVLSNFRIDNSNKGRVYFDSNEPITGTSHQGFYLSDNLRKTITGVHINSGQTTGHYFTSSANFDYWDTYAIRYEGGSDIQDMEGDPLYEFWLFEVVNNIPEPLPSGTAYFVRTTGSDNNDGLSHETAFRTINKALSLNARTLYVEAGDYGSENLVFRYNGTATQPIIMQGYKTITNGIPDPIEDNYWSWGSYGTGTNCRVDETELPTLTGTPSLRNSYSPSGWAITTSDYIIIKNFQTINWNMGFRINSSDHMTLKNVTCIYNGNTSRGLGGGIWVVGGEGQGVDMYNKFINVEVAQSAAVGVRMYGGASLFDNVNVHNDIAEGNTYSSPDYYLHVYEGSNNIFKNCTVKEIGITPGSSHGIGLKGGDNGYLFPTEYNLITDCEIRNMQGAIEFRHEDVKNNVARNLNIYSLPQDGAVSGAGNNSHGVVVRDNSSFNKVENVIMDSQYRSIYFTDSSEQGPQTSGHDCIFRNIIITNGADAIGTSGNSTMPPVYNNEFYNLTIDNCDRLFMSNGSLILNSTNTLVNSSISNVERYGSTNIIQRNNNYYNNAFTNNPSGTNITKYSPEFMGGGDYHLQSTSALNNAGTEVPNYYDFDGIERIDGYYSIGAYEDQVPVTGSVSPDTTICEGESATLIATGGTSYLWNTGDTTESITVSPTATTTYTVTVTDGDSSGDHEVIVTVNEAPNVSITQNDLTICSGEEVTLTAAGEGSFLWSTGETDESITVSPTETMTYTVTASNSCSSDATDQITITVNETPTLTVNTNQISICEGETAELIATSNSNLSWSTGETASNISVSPTENTTYTVTASNGTCSISETIEVLVGHAPSVAIDQNDLTICSGEQVTLTASGEGNFLWSTGATTASITVSPTATTIYTVTASNNCSTDASDEVIITVNETPTLAVDTFTFICTGENVDLVATSNGNLTWSTGETTSTINVSPTQTTRYTVTASIGDCSVTEEIEVEVGQAPSVSIGQNDLTICSGEEVTLTAAGEGSFLWSTGETDESITVSPTETMTYTVTASNSCSSDATDQITITVNETPTLTVNTNQISICEGETAELIATSNSNLSWSTGETASNISVSPTENTTYTVTASNGTCSISETIEVLVGHAPSVAIDQNDLTICSGEQVTLTASGEGNFLWSTGATTASITVSPTATTIYTVTASNNCSGDANDQVTITVNESPTLALTSDITINEGDNVTLEATGEGNFLWSTGQTTSVITVSPSTTTTYYVQLTSNQGCVVNKSVIVTVLSSQSGNNDVTANAGEDVEICKFGEVTLTASGGENYLWSTGETTSSITVSPDETTTYHVSVSRGNSIDSDEVTVFVDETCSVLGNKPIFSELKVFPNPTRGVLHIELYANGEDINVSIFNLSGVQVYYEDITNYSTEKLLKHRVNLTKFSKGIYFIQFINGGTSETKKILLI